MRGREGEVFLSPILAVVEGSVNGVRRDEQAKTKSKRRKKKKVRKRLGQPMIFFRFWGIVDNLSVSRRLYYA